MEAKKLYKLDSKGKLRFLKISVEEGNLIQESGIEGSAKIVKHTRVCTPKNVGRSNATTAPEQAIKEAESKITEKLQEGYYETPEAAQLGELILPMLAKDFKTVEKKIKYPCFVQPKLDGMRTLKSGVKFISRENREITTISHLQEEFKDLIAILDGELYAHGLSFQENMKLLKKYREGETENIKFHIYDILLYEVPYEERYKTLQSLFEFYKPANCELVPTYIINNKEELLEYHSKFLGEGYEGTIIRWSNTGYEPNKRSSSLVKFKDFIDITAKVIDVVPQNKRPTHGKLICETEDGKVFSANLKFPHKIREEILTNKQDYIGETAEIRFFEYTDEGKPRFPVCVGFRLDK